MSDAREKLSRSRQAILEHIARRQRRHDPREEPPESFAAWDEQPYGQPHEPAGTGWFGHMRYVLRMWWRHHPAHMAVELASPLMRSYARRRPVQLLAISAAAGAALTFARPWKLISLGTLVVALLKSSQLSSLVMAAISAADYPKDNNRP